MLEQAINNTQVSMQAEKSLEKLQSYIEQEGFKGYDPYDTLLSPFPFRIFGRWGQAIATQIQKRNPVNIRPLIGIKKDYNPKGMGLLLRAYILLQQNFQEKDYSKQIDFIYNWIVNNRNIEYKNACWGYNFGWANPEKYLPPYAPNVVVTAFIARGIFDYYKLTGNTSALEILLSAAEFVDNDLPVTVSDNGLCYSYSPFMTDCCYNASLLAAETLASVFSITGNEDYKSKAIKAVEFVLAMQHDDGHWEYKIDPDTGKERHQVDFHQGYVIDSIDRIREYINHDDPSWIEAVRKGTYFYRHQQFFESGQSKWRLPHVYPVEIHNQSQGIITFSRQGKEYTDFAKQILQWTIDNMQDRKGYFYYRKLKFYTNKISFMRWSNAWMFLALAEHIDAVNKSK